MKQRYISLLMALVLTLTTVLAPVPAALAGGMSALYVDGKAYEGEDLFVGWNYYKGDFDHYEYSVNDLTLDEDTAEIFRVNIGQETSINIPGELIINRHHYRVWVGACDASGNALDSSKTEFYGVSRQKDEELVLSISEAYAGQNVKISWNKIEGAEGYEYTLLDLTTDEYLEEREPISKCYFTLYGEDVYGAHEYKLWVGAIDGNGDVICQNIQYFTPIACSHGNTSHVESSRTCVSISDKQHSVTQVYDEMCLDCGETIATGLTETFDEKHVLDANGDCTLCDLRVSCPHTEKRYEEMLNAYADENENEHTHDIQYSEYCANPVCGKLLRLQADEKRVYTHEAHSFENDVCTKCGRIRADELKITVARDQSEAEPGDTISATATPMGGSGKHTIAWEVYCGGTLVREKTPFDNQLNMSFTPEQEGEYFFRAYLYDGEQQVYGDSAVITVKKGECQHTNVQETLGSSVYNSVSDTTHELEITWVTVCQDCGSQRSQRVETQTLAHTFVNGACTECGSLDGSGPCKHTNVVSTETGTRMYSITTLQHVIETYYRDECADCGMTIIESRVSPREEAHQIVNGSCVCGYVQPSEECDHVNQTDVLTGESYVSASATQHEVIRTYKVTCDDCSQVVNANKTTSEMAAHALDANAYCPLCGYSGQCAHSKTKDVWQYDSYAPLPDGKKHTKTEVYSRFCADPDCGQLLLAADPSLSKTKEEKHKYDDDECRFCGYVRAKAFAVTITLDQTQAAKGDTIGAQAKPVGGSGVYSFYWEAYCDGALVSSSSTAQTQFTCTASVEGSWLFRAIVRDTVNGESLAAQSGVLIVSGCDHTPTTVPTGRTTVERNWDDDRNTHIAITPSHTSCECGLININEDVRQPVKHDYTYYSGVQALHEDQGHALFERCACGVARTTGVYQATLDGCEKCAGATTPVIPSPVTPIPALPPTTYGPVLIIPSPTPTLNPDHRHSIGTYYDDDLNPHEYCVICQPRSKEQLKIDGDNALRYAAYLKGVFIQKRNIRVKSAKENIVSMNDPAMIALRSIKERNEDLDIQLAAYAFKTATFQWFDVIKKAVPGSMAVDKIRAKAIQAAVESHFTQGRQVEDNDAFENALNSILTAADGTNTSIGMATDFTERFGLVKITGKELSNAMGQFARFEQFRIKDVSVDDFGQVFVKASTVRTGGALSDKTISWKGASPKVGPILQVLSFLVDTGFDLAEYADWNEGQRELFYVMCVQTDSSIAFLEELMKVYGDDKVLAQYCREMVTSLKTFKTSELISFIREHQEQANDIRDIILLNSGETILEFGFPTAVELIFSGGNFLTAVGAIGGLVAEIAGGTNTTADLYEEIDILYTSIEQSILLYHQTVNDPTVSDAAKHVQLLNIMYQKTAALEMACRLNKGRLVDTLEPIVVDYRIYAGYFE